MTYHHCGTLLWRGVCHFDTRPRKFSRGACQNDIPLGHPGQLRKKFFVKIFGEKSKLKFHYFFFRQKILTKFLFRVLARVSGGYVILTRGPENFPEARVKMTYPLSHIWLCDPRKMILARMTYHHCGTLLWRGVCHFDTRPRKFSRGLCQNDIPPTHPGQKNLRKKMKFQNGGVSKKS